MKQKWIAIAVSLLLVFAFVLTGCVSSTTKDQTKDDGNTDKDKKIEIAAPNVYPIVPEKVNLRVLMGGNAAVEDFNTNDFSLWYEEKTNVHVNYEVLPEKSYEEKVTLIMAIHRLCRMVHRKF